MNIEKFISILKINQITFFTGVPDSQLRALCDFLDSNKDMNITAANEGNALAIAAGYHLSTGNTPCVYLQNSGLGNLINPYASLTQKKVYAIPTLFIIGWRGEPNIKDEPQHTFQGEITINLLDALKITYFIITKETTEDEIKNIIKKFNTKFENGESCAFVIKKEGFSSSKQRIYINNYTLNRERVLEIILENTKKDIVVSTTGKTSREIFEIREKKHQSHRYDFLTVGSMGHCSSIALGIALNKPNSRVWCIDGDGAALMHMGSMAIIGNKKPNNLIHIIINNESHESVGGMPTLTQKLSFKMMAESCGYENVFSVQTENDLIACLSNLENKLTGIEIKVAIGSRSNLGRPTTTPINNKLEFMKYLEENS